MADRQIFEKPPLKEAVLEFHFQEGEEGWDSLLLGKIHARIEDDFPSVTRVRGPSGVSIELTPSGGNTLTPRSLWPGL